MRHLSHLDEEESEATEVAIQNRRAGVVQDMAPTLSAPPTISTGAKTPSGSGGRLSLRCGSLSQEAQPEMRLPLPMGKTQAGHSGRRVLRKESTQERVSALCLGLISG